MNLFRTLVFGSFLGVLNAHGNEDPKKPQSQEVAAPFGKAYVSVLLQQDPRELLFYVVISKRNDTPAILSKDVSAVVLDQNGKAINCTPAFPDHDSLVEVGSIGTSANKIYQLTPVSGQKPTSATVTFLGRKLEFKTIESSR